MFGCFDYDYCVSIMCIQLACEWKPKEAALHRGSYNTFFPAVLGLNLGSPQNFLALIFEHSALRSNNVCCVDSRQRDTLPLEK